MTVLIARENNKRKEEMQSFNEDLNILSEHNGQLQEKVKYLEKEIQVLDDEITKERWKRRFENIIISISILTAILFILTLVGYPLYMNITSSSSPTHCYIKRSANNGTSLMGNIEWGEDIVYGDFCSIEQALNAANEIGCGIVSRQ